MIFVLPAIARSLDQTVMVAKVENAPANLDSWAKSAINLANLDLQAAIVNNA